MSISTIMRASLLAVGTCVAMAATSVAARADSFGAIAIDFTKMERSPYYGVGGGDSEGEATKNALQFCMEAGGKDCKLAVTYTQCGAYASNGSVGGWGKAATKKEAEQGAISGCADGKCKVVVSDCN
jgi:hypothetical protein